MILYKINGVYPDKNFNFVVSAAPLGLVPISHTHTRAQVDDLNTTINGLENAVHDHTAVKLLFAGEEPEFQDILTIQSETVSGQSCSFSANNDHTILTISYTSQPTGHAGFLLNDNPQADQFVLQVAAMTKGLPTTTETGVLYLAEKKLDFITQTAEEFIKQVSTATSTDTSDISSIRLVTKVMGGLQTKEVWPISAQRLKLETNYDFSPGRTLPDTAYPGPTMDKTLVSTPALIITVTPYPESACWKIGHSANITDSTFFNTIYKGPQTVTVPFSLSAPTGDYEYTWINVYPASSSGTADPVKFRFWCKGTASSSSGSGSSGSGSSGSGSSGSGSGDSGSGETGGDPASPSLVRGLVAYWDFRGSTPLVDSVGGKSLETFKNPSTASAHIAGAGPTGSCLSNILAQDANAVIDINGHHYGYAAVLNQDEAAHAKFAWYSIDLNTTLYTETSSPDVGDTVYNADDTATEYTVELRYIENYNSWETILDQSIAEDELTIAYYLKPAATVFGSNEIGVQLGLKDGTFSSPLLNIHYDTKLRYRVGAPNYTNGGLTSGDIQCTFTNGFHSMVASLSHVIDVLNPEEQYTPQRGYGVVLHEGYMIWGLGNFYVRDRLKDLEIDGTNYYAYSWQNVGITGCMTTVPSKEVTVDETTTTIEYPTVWMLTETPVNNTKCYDSTGTELPFNHGVSGNFSYEGWQYYAVQFVESRWQTAPKIETWSGKIASGYYSAPTKDGARYLRYYMYWEHGTYKGLKSTGLMYGHGNYSNRLLVDLGKTSSDGKTTNAIADLRIYNRFLSAEEILDHNAILTGEVVETTTTTGAPVSDKDLEKYVVPQKIHVANAWYEYNPFKTVYKPTLNDSTAAMFGWDRISGTGADVVYTSEYPPKTTEFCRLSPDGAADGSLRVTESTNINIAETSLPCQLLPFIIDSKTIAVIIWTHNAVMKELRTMYPNVEAIMKRSEFSIESYKYGEYLNVPLWVAHHAVQKQICTRADNEALWQVDGNSVTLRDRAYVSPFIFRIYKDEMQWRNCKPGDKYYSESPELRGEDYASIEVSQIAYLTLPTAMTIGSTHEVTWQGNTCSITYGPEQYCATIKVNQEGYLPYPGIKRYAYLGRWTGTGEYTPAQEDRTFYIVPSGSTSTADAIFSGTMTQRCVAHDRTGLCSDMYGYGSYANSKPITRENTFEMDFTNLTTCHKDTIVAGGTTYFRDTVEDEPGGQILISGGTFGDVNYYRDIDKDTCNAYAWTCTAVDADGRQQTIYTDKKTPEVDDLCRLGYDDTPTADYTINSVVNIDSLLGWSTERATEAAWSTSQTVWTRSSDQELITNNVFTNVFAKPTCNWFSFHNDSGVTANNVTAYTANVETADVSGKYQVYIPNIGWSFEFLLHPQALFHQFWIHMRGLYHQRSGCPNVHHPWTNWEYPKPTHDRVYDGNFVGLYNDEGQGKNTDLVWRVDPVTHETHLDEYGAKTQLSGSGKAFSQNSVLDGQNVQPLWSVYGGWCDAADFDMRDKHEQIFGELATAYIWFPDNFYDGQLDLPESGDGVPDILSEALWGAELYRKAQDTQDGGIRGWFESSGHESDWPWLSSKKYYACARSKRMSVWYLAPAARLARAFRLAASRTSDATARARMENISNAYLESALAAWNFLMLEYDAPYILKNVDDRVPTYFESRGLSWAWRENLGTCQTERSLSSGFKTVGTQLCNGAAALYVLTKDSKFLPWLSTQAATNMANEWFGNENEKGEHFPYEWIHDLSEELPVASNIVKNKVLQDANNWVSRTNAHAYRWINWKPDKAGRPDGEANFQHVGWGTSHPDTRGFSLLAGYYLTGDEKYRSALLNGFDHICGCNCLGRTFTPWLGKVFPNRYLDHWTPRDLLLNGCESARPGVTPDILGDNKQIAHKALTTAMGGVASERGAANGLILDHFPAKWRTYYQVTISNWKENLYYSQMPYYSVGQLWGNERENVQGFEFTVDSTISRKAQLIGCLMGAVTRHKHNYKQIDRLKRADNLENLAILP